MQYNANANLMSRNNQIDFRMGSGGLTPFVKPLDPAGASVRRLVQPAGGRDTSMDPFVGRMPNKAYGDAYGLEWDGERWVKANPNADLERQAMELELEKRRQDLARSQYGDSADSMLSAWLAKRLGRSE